MTYFLIPTLFNREMIMPGLAKWQPYLFGLGMGVFCLAMMGAGTLGVPRRHWDITFAGAALPYEFPGTAWLMLAVMGVSGLVAIVGGASYILITVGSLLWGKRLDAGAYSGQSTILRMPSHGADRTRQRRLRGARHLRLRDGVPGGVRPVLLRELEVPVHGMGPELNEGGGEGRQRPAERLAAGRIAGARERTDARTDADHVESGQRCHARADWRTVLAVFKLRIGVIIALTAMAGIAVQPGVELSAAQVTAIFFAVLLASASAGAFNQYYEVDLDHRMRRTRARPFAAGRLQKHGGWLAVIIALAAIGVALAWMATNAVGGAVHVPRRLLLRGRLHRLAQAPDLVEHRDRRHGRQLRRARGRRRGDARAFAAGAAAWR